jgi:hypothetical protein
MTDTRTSNPPPSTGEKSTAEQAKEKAADVAASATQSAGEVAGEAKDKAAEVAVTAADQLGSVVGTARQELRSKAADEASNLGRRLEEIAEELRAMGTASSEHGGVAANLVTGVADQVDRSARRLSEGDLDAALEDVKRFARNRPGTFLLGAMGAGFAVGRLLRHADLKEVGQAAKPQSDTSNGSGNGLSNGYTSPSLPAPSAIPESAAPAATTTPEASS